MVGVMDWLGSFTKSDVGGILGGVGQLAGAWGSYKATKDQNKLIMDQLNYEKQKDALANQRFEEDRAAINEAFGITKKKKTTADDGYALNAFNGE